MFTIRNSTFETNSSSTHSIVIGTEKQFEDWRAGTLLYKHYAWSYDKLEKGFYTLEELKQYLIDDGEYTKVDIEAMDQDELLDILREDDIVDYDNWYENLEHDTHTYTTASGEKIVIECAYGYD